MDTTVLILLGHKDARWGRLTCPDRILLHLLSGTLHGGQSKTENNITGLSVTALGWGKDESEGEC